MKGFCLGRAQNLEADAGAESCSGAQAPGPAWCFPQGKSCWNHTRGCDQGLRGLGGCWQCRILQ